jgi:hypothetical protein
MTRWEYEIEMLFTAMRSHNWKQIHDECNVLLTQLRSGTRRNRYPHLREKVRAIRAKCARAMKGKT